MQQLFPDLWQTSPERPIAQEPRAVCHAYLLTRPQGNVLIYGVGREQVGTPDVDADLDRIADLGGVEDILLGHWHEAAPTLRVVRERFDARVHCHARDAAMISREGGVVPDEVFWERSTLLDEGAGGFDAVPTPGHTVGSACYQYRSPHGRAYLFTGDVVWALPDGWGSMSFEDDAEQSAHRASLDLLATLRPDVVFPAVGNDPSYVELDPADWPAATATVKAALGR